ncbi:hypothetical protein K439DRAFT_833127 [Ramaria rubella]|nr:hypothetical protein K439DRAFT_833127 [Ramaria rubella]
MMISAYADSDTELEDDENVLSLDCDVTYLIFSASQTRCTPSVNLNEVAQSIDVLESKIPAETKDKSLHNTIHTAASILLDFIQILIDARRNPLSVSYQPILCSILRPSFLSRLLEYRQVFNSMTANAAPPHGTGSTLFCWADVVIARLGEAILSISGRGCFVRSVDHSESAEEAALDNFMSSQTQKSQSVRVASQLPESWHAIISMLGSEDVSEAARRLSLSLVFGAYILCWNLSPRSERYRHRNTFQLNPLKNALQKYISRMSREYLTRDDEGLLAANLEPLEENAMNKSQYAMIITLFAHLELSHLDPSHPIPSFRPSTFGVLLMLIESLMNRTMITNTAVPSLLTPGGTVDQNQCRLLGWGLTIPWCWTVWGGEKSMHLGTVMRLTTTWLYHFALTEVEVERVLHFDPVAALSVMLPLIAPQSPGNFNPTDRAILYKSCWSISCLGRRHLDTFDDLVLTKICKSFFALLLSLGCNDIDASIREILLDFFSWLPQRFMKLVFSSNLPPNILSMSIILNEAVERVITSPAVSATDADQCTHVKSSLEVLIVLISSGAPEASNVASSQPLVDHILSMLNQSSWWNKETQESGVLLLGCMARFEPPAERFIYQPALLCASLILRLSAKDFVMAAAVAVYIHGVAKYAFIDSLTLMEIWDYLRDVMLVILRSRQSENQHNLASRVHDTISSALNLILTRMPAAHNISQCTARFALDYCAL